MMKKIAVRDFSFFLAFNFFVTEKSYLDMFQKKFLYKCRYSNIIYDYFQLCRDYEQQCSSAPHCSILNCPRGDDELSEICNSNFHCPENCKCWNPGEIFCKNGNIFFKNDSSKYYMKSLYLENVNGGEILQKLNQIKEFYLIALNIRNSKITENSLILPFPNLKYLNLSSNSIRIISRKHFVKTINLEILMLFNNKFEYFEEYSMEYLINLKELIIENSNLRFLGKYVFPKLNKLKTLKILNSRILNIDNFVQNLLNLEELNLRKSHLNEKGVNSDLNFQFNKKLRLVISEYYTLCCFVKKNQPSAKCHAKKRDFFSCENLIGSVLKKGYP